MGGWKAYPFVLDEARCSGKDRIQCSEPASIQISQMSSVPGASGSPASVTMRVARAGRSFLPPLGSTTAKSAAGWSPSVLRFVWTLRATFVDFIFFFQAEDGIRDLYVTGVQTCALPI